MARQAPAQTLQPTGEVGPALPACLINGLTGEISGGERLSPGFHTPSSTSQESTPCLTVGVTGAKEGQAGEFLPPMMGVRSRGIHFLFGREIRSYQPLPLLLSIHPRYEWTGGAVHPSSKWIAKKCP